MRGTKAKRLRREIYGDAVTSAKGRSYRVLSWVRKALGKTDSAGKSVSVRRETVGADDLRRQYQQAKGRGRRTEP